MHSDLQNLEITETELNNLTGLDIEQIITNSKSSNRVAKPSKITRRVVLTSLGIGLIVFVSSISIFINAFRVPALIFIVCTAFGGLGIAVEAAELGLVALILALISGFYAIYVLFSAPTNLILTSLAIAICTSLIFTLISPKLTSIFTTNKTQLQAQQNQFRPSKYLINLLGEIEKYNKVIKDINVFDCLKEVGNPISLQDRDELIAALTITRSDLVRALKTEKILRENPDFNPEKFAVNLSAFQALQISDRASDYGRLFDVTLQIAIDVQQEMRQLENNQ